MISLLTVLSDRFLQVEPYDQRRCHQLKHSTQLLTADALQVLELAAERNIVSIRAINQQNRRQYLGLLSGVVKNLNSWRNWT